MDREDIQLIADSLERILQDAPLAAIDDAKGAGEGADALWNAIEASGFIQLAVAEQHGGLGASLADCLPLAFLCGQYALPAPLVDAMCAHALCSAAGMTPENTRIGLVTQHQGKAYCTHGEQLSHGVQIADGVCRVLELGEGALTPVSLGEDGAAHIDLTSTKTVQDAPAPNWLTPDTYLAIGAAFRSAQMAGAMRTILETSLGYTSEREQFGRPLAKFQAVQQLLSDMACETAAAAAAVELASDGLRADPQLGASAVSNIAAAKVRCAAAAEVVAANAHQAHGALGFTWEYSLGRFTRRLWQWQDEFGPQKHWAGVLGEHLLADNDQSLWEWVSA